MTTSTSLPARTTWICRRSTTISAPIATSRKGELEFDASIMGAHTVPIESAQLAGLVVNITKVDNGTAGKKPTVTFTLKDKSGKGLTMTTVSRVSASLVPGRFD